MQLKPFNEIIGTLKSIEKQNNNLCLIFTIDRYIELPSDSISKEKLISFINKKIGIINCNGDFFVKEISKLKKEEEVENRMR